MFTPGALIDGRYEVLGLLASGGMGQVYRARRVRLGDEVAIKVISGPATDSVSADRFLRESRACARLRHPNIVGIYDYSVDALGAPYLVMELLSGPSLREELELHGAMPHARAMAILTAVGQALELAHEHGITHRDLKPANIVAHRYGSGEQVYKVIDFGLAAVATSTDATRLSSPFVFLGTLAYAAPEQLRGESVDPRTDVYALGVIACEMLTGCRPFDAENQVLLAGQVLNDAPEIGAPAGKALAPAARAVLARALAKERHARWASVQEFLDALAPALDHEPASDPGVDDARQSVGSGAHSRFEARSRLLEAYETGPVLGAGRLGSVVYSGTDRALNLPVAIRLLRRSDTSYFDAARSRFLCEARTLRVPHPSLLQVRDYGEDESGVYIVTDLVPGSSLRSALAQGEPLAWPRVARLVAQMLDAAGALHRRGGLLVGLSSDLVRLTVDDEGGERVVLSTAGIRTIQDVMATLAQQRAPGGDAEQLRDLCYVAPEMLIGQPPDPRADVFTIGALAYEMLTGALPFGGSILPELIGAMLRTTPPPATLRRPELPAAVDAVIARALVPDPDLRYRSARLMAEAWGAVSESPS